MSIEALAEAIRDDLEAERESLKPQHYPLLLALLQKLDALDEARRQLLRAERTLAREFPARMGQPPHPAKVAVLQATLALNEVRLDTFCESMAEKRVLEEIDDSPTAGEDCAGVAFEIGRRGLELPWPACLANSGGIK